MSEKKIVAEDGTFRVMIQCKNPKKNPVHHELVTIQDIFNVVNEKNLSKFIKEFKQALQFGIMTRELTKEVAKKIEAIFSNSGYP